MYSVYHLGKRRAIRKGAGGEAEIGVPKRHDSSGGGWVELEVDRYSYKYRCAARTTRGRDVR